jgi:glucokinase
MRAALVDPQGNVLLRRTAPTPRHGHVPDALLDLIASVASEDSYGAVSHAVVALPGAVDYEEGRLLWAPNLPATWAERLSRDTLSSRLALPVYIANDADMAALGESVCGAGAGARDVAYLTISTGIGAGVVQAGRLAHGRRSLAEVGHTIIDVESWREGRPSTLEELGSGSGVARLAREQGMGELDARGVGAAASEGNATAVGIWEGAIAACAAGVENLVMSFYPSVIVIGGGMGSRDDFFHPLRELVLTRAEHHPADLAIVRSALGDDAGLIGAAVWERAIGPS